MKFKLQSSSDGNFLHGLLLPGHHKGHGGLRAEILTGGEAGADLGHAADLINVVVKRGELMLDLKQGKEKRLSSGSE